MKNPITTLILIFALTGLGANQYANADVTFQQADEMFDLAEQAFPEFFSPSDLDTLTFPPDYPYYRGPYDDGVFVGISADDDVYVLGGPFGSAPINVGSFSSVLSMLESELDSGDSICNTNDNELPEGLNYSQNGNTVTITTDGCIVIADVNQNLCESPDSTDTPQATGISVLSETNIFSSELNGITSSNSMILDSFDITGETTACIQNAVADFAPSTVNIDICYDLTESFSQLSSLPNVTVTPPVTQSIESTTINSIVNDCFTTGAQVINDNFTGDTWILQPTGDYLMIPNI